MRIIGPDDRQLSLDQLGGLPVVDAQPTAQDSATAQETSMTTTSEKDQDLDQAPDVIFTRLQIEAFRGIDFMELDLKEHPRGVIFAGTKAIGKTSAIRSIEADLWGAGVDKSAIKTDATGTKVSMTFLRGGQEMTAVRSISKSKTEAKLIPADGIPLPKAVEQLRAYFGQGIGSGGRDPLRLYSASKEELRKLLLQAVPCAVTGEQLSRWCEEERPWNVDGHGQEVLARVKDTYFSLRTDSGRDLDKAAEEVKTRENDVAKLRAPDLPSITAAVAQTHVAAAERQLAVLHDRRRQVAEREAAAEGTRTRIAKLRQQAEEIITSDQQAERQQIVERVGLAKEIQARTWETVIRLRDELAKAEAAAKAADQSLVDAEKLAKQVTDDAATAERYLAQASELEAAIVTATGDDPQSLAEQITAAEGALDAAREVAAKAVQADSLRAAEAKAEEARAAHKAKLAEWEKLDRIVKRLTTEAPAELAKQGNPIPGLEITPKAILWNGHDLDLSSDGEKLEFAVEVVKRTATGAKVMVIDKLEHLPQSLRPTFVRNVLRGGWVLFATLVQDGPMEVVDVYRLAKHG